METFENIIAEVDAVQAQFSHVNGIINQIETYDARVGKDLKEAFESMMSRMAYHVNAAIRYAYMKGGEDAEVQSIEVDIKALMDECDVSPLVALPGIVQFEDREQYATDFHYFEPADVSGVLPGGEVDWSDGTIEQYSIVSLNNGTNMMIIGERDQLLEYINFLRSEDVGNLE